MMKSENEPLKILLKLRNMKKLGNDEIKMNSSRSSLNETVRGWPTSMSVTSKAHNILA
jgi:hypothetical protein